MRCNKTVSFNVSDPDDLELFNHAIKVNPLTGKAQNFSKYVKRLIDNDLRGVGTHIRHPTVEGNTKVNEEVKNAMSSFL